MIFKCPSCKTEFKCFGDTVPTFCENCGIKIENNQTNTPPPTLDEEAPIEPQNATPEIKEPEAIIVEKKSTASKAEKASDVCPVCFTPIEEGEENIVCEHCKIKYHKECWIENNGCATYGCVSTGCVKSDRITIDMNDLNMLDYSYNSNNIPASYCPRCNTKLEYGSMFCWSCGRRITNSHSYPNTQSKYESLSNLPLIITVILLIIFIILMVNC